MRVIKNILAFYITTGLNLLSLCKIGEQAYKAYVLISILTSTLMIVESVLFEIISTRYQSQKS